MPKTRYDSHKFTAVGASLADAIKEKAEELAGMIDDAAGVCRTQSLAQTHLQTAVMFAVRAVAEAHHE